MLNIFFGVSYVVEETFFDDNLLFESRCAALKDVPRVPNNFHKRDESDRYEAGTRATLIKNATIWTGMANGTEIVYGDILLDKGLVKHIGDIPQSLLAHAFNLTVVHANGAWVTPGLGEAFILPCPAFYLSRMLFEWTCIPTSGSTVYQC